MRFGIHPDLALANGRWPADGSELPSAFGDSRSGSRSAVRSEKLSAYPSASASEKPNRTSRQDGACAQARAFVRWLVAVSQQVRHVR